MLRNENACALARVSWCRAIALAPLGLLATATAASAQMDYRSPRQNYGYQSPSQNSGYGGYASSPSSWQGLYGGVHLGYGWGSVTTGAPMAASTSNDGGIGGFHFGYNWQNRQFVLGLEGDLGASWAAGHGTNPANGVDISTSTSWISSLRGRAGYSFGSTMVYATGGMALARTDVALSDGLWAGKADGTLLGWVIGAGIEHKLAANVSARLEAMHYQFNSKEITGLNGVIPFSTDQTVVRAGITFHLK